MAVTWWGWWLPGIPPAAPPRPALAAAGTPEAAVEAYFCALGCDPLRTLPLLTDAAHRRHGLRLADTAAAEESVGDAATVERHQAAWLSLQKRGSFRALAARLAVAPGGATVQEGDRVWVPVGVEAPAAPPFVQRFALVRGRPDAPWRIDEVTQKGVHSANASAAFAAWPDEALRVRLASPETGG